MERKYTVEGIAPRIENFLGPVLRMAGFELGQRPDVPTGVILNEAVDLAKRYSTDDSGRFVNGVLAAVAAEART